MREEKLIIPWVGPSLNTIWAGKHWSFRNKLAKDGHTAVMAVANWLKPFENPVELIFEPHVRGRKFDICNYALTAKAIEDGLVEIGVLKGDSEKHVKQITLQAPKRAKQSSTWLIIREMCSE